MIEKLDLDNGYATVDWLPTQHGKRCGAREIQTTVNQLVDGVNELQLVKDVIFNRIDMLNNAICDIRNATENSQSAKIAQGFKNLQDHRPNMVMDDPFGPHPNTYEQGRPADPYAEQRKWVGKICVFWDNDDTQEFSYGVLTAIDTDFGVGYSCNGEYEYDNCEPVKPDDDIIYKGGDNE